MPPHFRGVYWCAADLGVKEKYTTVFFHQKLCFSNYNQALFLPCFFLVVKLVPLEELVPSCHSIPPSLPLSSSPSSFSHFTFYLFFVCNFKMYSLRTLIIPSPLYLNSISSFSSSLNSPLSLISASLMCVTVKLSLEHWQPSSGHAHKEKWLYSCSHCLLIAL